MSHCSRCDKPLREEPVKCASHKGYICMNCIGYVDRQDNHYCFDCVATGQAFENFMESELNVT